MKQVATYVWVDAHKKDLFIAVLMGDQTTPVTWQLANEPNAVRRWVRNSSARPQVHCACVTKPGRAATRYNAK